MSTTIYEIIRGLEITKVKSMTVRTSQKVAAQKLQDLDKRIRLSLNQLPPIYRMEALQMITEMSGSISLWASEQDFIISKLDTSIRELKVREHMELTEEIKVEDTESYQTHEPEGKV